MKNILITTGIFEPDIGGPASYAMALASKLSSNHSVTVITFSSVKKYAKDKDLPFKVVRIWGKLPRIFKYLLYLIKILSYAGKSDMILALNAASAGLSALIAARLKHKKLFVKIVGDHAWETAVNSGRTFLLADDFQKTNRKGWIGYLHRLQCWICKRADGIIVPSQYLANMVSGWGIDGNKIKVIYNGTNFKPIELTHEEARNKIGVHGNIILTAGRLVPWKGFRMLIKIMPKLLDINQFFRLVIIGSGPDRKSLEAMIKNLGLDKKVFLVGKKTREEMAVYLASADLFILNTGYEGFSHQLLEAMSAGAPIITTSVGGNKEIIKQGENGFMIKYNDEFNLIEAVKTLWKMPELREEFAGEGKKTVARFSFDNMLNETLKYLNI